MSKLVAAALAEYALTEPEIRAWVEVNPQEPLGAGPLDGIPFGVKDIFETTSLATEYGSPLYSGRKGSCEASIVTALRRLGGVLFGKTQTAAFAYFDPPPTRNPRNVGHTPGGSSSGSAAAVAAGVVPFALGTQTMGSIIRPASYCGVAGFKPTFGMLPRDGVLPFAPSLDTVGFLADSVSMCARIWRALGYPVAESVPLRFAIPSDLPAVSEEMQSQFGMLISEYDVECVAMPEPYDDLLQAARTVNDCEGARTHFARWKEFGDRIGVKLSGLIQRGMTIPDAEYRERLALLRSAAAGIDKLLAGGLILLTPAAPGAAPTGLESTGDPMMNAVWTALGTPAAAVPMRPAGGLPLGLQMIARRGNDGMLLGASLEVERAIQK
jgi:Asp-tRNA(Asn)/Glu-tRNA(Gln) amidotransferase A subunit family amidase